MQFCIHITPCVYVFGMYRVVMLSDVWSAKTAQIKGIVQAYILMNNSAENMQANWLVHLLSLVTEVVGKNTMKDR